MLDMVITKHPKSTIYVVEDFNMPDIEWADHSVKALSSNKSLHQDFMNCFYESGFKQLIFEPTHVEENTLDLVFINSESGLPRPLIINPGLSDHYMVELDMIHYFNKRSVRAPPRTIWLHDNADCKGIANSLQKTIQEIKSRITETLLTKYGRCLVMTCFPALNFLSPKN